MSIFFYQFPAENISQISDIRELTARYISWPLILYITVECAYLVESQHRLMSPLTEANLCLSSPAWPFRRFFREKSCTLDDVNFRKFAPVKIYRIHRDLRSFLLFPSICYHRETVGAFPHSHLLFEKFLVTQIER